MPWKPEKWAKTEPKEEDASKKKGYRLVGDVAYDEVAPKCHTITPVPGGVGPMTIALLMSNTVKAAEALSRQ